MRGPAHRWFLHGFSFMAALVLLRNTVSGTLLRPRANDEHVVLADCRDGDGIVSSQMAYFPGNPGPKPQDVAVVATAAGQAALWAGRTTAAQWTDTGVVFKAVLGPKWGEGMFAGTGDNGYGNFTCWQRFSLNLYEYSGTTCSMVYDCDHEKAPLKASLVGTSSAPVATNTAPGATNTAPGATNASNAASTPSGTPVSSSLSTGAIAGIAVGVGGTALIAAAAAAFFLLRRRSRQRVATADATDVSPKDPPPVYANQADYPIYEMDGQWHGVEAGGHSRSEMEALTTPQEMEARRKSTMSEFKKG